MASKRTPTLTAGTCSHPGCSNTLVMYIGGGQFVCWLHAIGLGLLALPDAKKAGT